MESSFRVNPEVIMKTAAGCDKWSNRWEFLSCMTGNSAEAVGDSGYLCRCCQLFWLIKPFQTKMASFWWFAIWSDRLNPEDYLDKIRFDGLGNSHGKTLDHIHQQMS